MVFFEVIITPVREPFWGACHYSAYGRGILVEHPGGPSVRGGSSSVINTRGWRLYNPSIGRVIGVSLGDDVA